MVSEIQMHHSACYQHCKIFLRTSNSYNLPSLPSSAPLPHSPCYLSYSSYSPSLLLLLPTLFSFPPFLLPTLISSPPLLLPPSPLVSLPSATLQLLVLPLEMLPSSQILARQPSLSLGLHFPPSSTTVMN